MRVPTVPSDDVSGATRQSLIGRIKDPADAASWEEFFKLYWLMIYNQARNAGLREDQASEVVQIVLIAVARNIKKFRNDPSFGSFRNWLFGLTRWRIEDVRKRDRRSPLSFDEAFSRELRREDAGTSPEGRLPDSAPLPSEALDLAWAEDWEQAVQARTLEIFRRAVTDSKKYQVFVEYVVRGTPPLQVARNLDVNIANVYLIKHRLDSRYHAARKRAEEEAEKPCVPDPRTLKDPPVA